MLALGLAVVAVLSAIALGISATQSNQKLSDQTSATALANQEIEQFVYALPSATDTFWSRSAASFNSPYQTDPIQLGNTPFVATIFLPDVSTLGSGVRLAVVNVSWGSGAQGRTGYGQQAVQISRLIYAH